MAIVFAHVVHGDGTWLIGRFPPQKHAGCGLALPGMHAVWIVVALYPLCSWFAALKQRRREWWWSYLCVVTAAPCVGGRIGAVRRRARK